MDTPRLFNPLDKLNLGISVVEALLQLPDHPLNKLGRFRGAGVYALYYRGEFPPYAKLAKVNRTEANFPIYVGKAVPKGGRKGTICDASAESHALSDRLKNTWRV